MTTILLTLVLAGNMMAQEAPRLPQATASEEYLVGPQDVISLTIFNDDSLSRPALIVDADGTIDCPYVGRVKVTGMTTRQIEEELGRRLGVRRDEQGNLRGYLRNPNISVAVKEFRSQSVHVTGAVRNPGDVELRGDLTLIRALSQAGYPTPDSGSYVIITHASDGRSTSGIRPEDQVRVTREDIDNGLASRIRLRPGDTIKVPTADKFFINGEVKAPNQYILSGPLNVLQALAVAGGLTDRANKNNIRILREVNGKTVEIKAKDSTPVMPGDTIVVRRRIF